jgi:hypothetical protein
MRRAFARRRVPTPECLLSAYACELKLIRSVAVVLAVVVALK